MEIKQYKKYSDIPKQYRFDLEGLLNGKTLDQIVDEIIDIYTKRISMKDSKYDNIESYLEDIKLEEQQTILMFKVHNYISNNLNTNLVSGEWRKLKQDLDFKFHKLDEEFGSEKNRFYKHIDKMKIWKEDPRLKSYKRHIEDDIEAYSHKLSDEVENYLIDTQLGQPNMHQVFSIITNSEMDYGTITTSKGKKIQLNPTNRTKLAKSTDKKVRKQAYINFWKAYDKHKESLANVLFQHFSQIVSTSKARKYKSPIEMLTSKDKVSDEVLQKLFEQVSANRGILKRFTKLHKKFYKAKFGEKQEKWDGSRELVNVKTSYSVEEAKELVLEALKPFGDEYIKQVQHAFDNNWIDFMPAHGKRSGAYSIGATYGIDKKYILMNFDGQLRSVETLAHELGHSMHSYYSDTRQNLVDSQYPIFLAEIASIYNESMLYDYLLKNSNNDKLKFSILESMIHGFAGTVLRQVQWANYEYDLYQAIARGEASSSYESISKIYFENSKKYTLSDNKPKYNVMDNLGCIYVPHFYYRFYVYKYAIGQLTACYFFNAYKEKGKEAIQNYIDNFLSAGGSDYPVKILEKVGVDLTSDKFYEDGFKYLESLVDEYAKLGHKIFKSK